VPRYFKFYHPPQAGGITYLQALVYPMDILYQISFFDIKPISRRYPNKHWYIPRMSGTVGLSDICLLYQADIKSLSLVYHQQHKMPKHIFFIISLIMYNIIVLIVYSQTAYCFIFASTFVKF